MAGISLPFWRRLPDLFVHFHPSGVDMLIYSNKIKGHILNVSSSSALRPAWTPYQMSKWSIRGFTMGLADLLMPYGIVVNAIAPGQTATPMLGKKTEIIYGIHIQRLDDMQCHRKLQH